MLLSKRGYKLVTFCKSTRERKRPESLKAMFLMVPVRGIEPLTY